MFQNLPQYVLDLILDNITTKYYKNNEIIHNEDDELKFMGVIFVGSVEYFQGKKIVKNKNDVVFSQAFYGKSHPTAIAKEETVLLTISKRIYPLIQKKIADDIEEKSRD